MLLPVVALLRRADLAAVIGAALVAKATGVGFRRIALVLARPVETVRGWLCRLVTRLEPVRALFTVWLRTLNPDPVMPASAGNAWADVVSVLEAVTAAVARRFVSTVSPWEVATVLSGGRFLAPGWPGVGDQHEFTLPGW